MKTVKYIIGITLGIILLISIISSITSYVRTKIDNITTPVEVDKKVAPISEKEKAEEVKRIYKADSIYYRNELEELKKFKVKKHEGYKDGFDKLRNHVSYYYDHKNMPACKYLNEEFKKELILKHIKYFPIFRDEFVMTMRADLWEFNIKVIGNNKTITFIGARYANNKNKADDMDKIRDKLKSLHFKTITFKWIEHDDDYTTYTLETLNDNDF